MRFVEDLTAEEAADLKRLWKSGPTPRVRQRAHAILLSAKGYKIDILADIFEVRRDAVSAWLCRWEEGSSGGGGGSSGSSGGAEERLADAPRSGRPPSIKEEHERALFEQARATPRQLKTALARLREEGLREEGLREEGLREEGLREEGLREKPAFPDVSLETVKRFLKKRGWRFGRIRRSLREKRNETAFRTAQADLEQLKAEEDAGLLDLVYFDAAGFSLEPSVSYAWQAPGERPAEVLSTKAPRINVLGFMQRDLRGGFTPYIAGGNVCSQTVIACIDAFARGLGKKTVLVLDRASVHTSAAFEKAQKRWERMGLRVFHLPSYSPELNLIERLWQEIKYRWLPSWAYRNRKTFAEALEEILVGIGSKYRITFA